MAIEMVLIFTICLIGSNIQAYNLGIRTGATGMIDNLLQRGDTDPKTGCTTIIIEPERGNG
jgi:hypothetical protein